MASNVTTTPRKLPSETATSVSVIASARGLVHCDAIVAAVGLKARLQTLAAFVGVLAARWPASGAARLPVLTAVASD